MGYKITIRANKISVCKPPYKRNIRIERNFGVEYSIKNIEDRILNSKVPRVPFPEERRKHKRYYIRTNYNTNKNRGSLYKLYLYYCYLLKKFPTNRNKIKISPEMRKDIKKMDTISSEIKFLRSHHIETTRELFSYKEEVMDRLNEKMKARAVLRRKNQKINDPDERQKLYDDIIALSNNIFELKREVGYCEDIKEKANKIRTDIKEMEEQENQKGKEKVKNELIRFS